MTRVSRLTRCAHLRQMGIVRRFRAFSSLRVFSALKQSQRPAHTPLPTGRFADASRWAFIGRAPIIFLNWRIEMPRNTYVVLFALIMIAVIVSVDLLFFRNRFWERLIANIGIVLVFVAFYLRFLKNP